MHNITYNTNQKSCLKLNMTTKGPSRKQIIIPMSQDNSNIIITCADKHIFNINRLLKSIKSDVTTDFLCSDNRGIIVTTNQIALSSVSQTSFGHISINSSTILTVSRSTESPQKDLLINASHILRQSIMAKILSRSTGNHHVTIY